MASSELSSGRRNQNQRNGEALEEELRINGTAQGFGGMPPGRNVRPTQESAYIVAKP